MIVCAIDPGKHASAFAVGDESGIVDAHYGPEFVLMYTADLVIAEKPMVYPGLKSRSPNDLIDVAIGLGLAIGSIPHKSLKMVAPRTWKGNIKKETMTNRIWSKMSDDECALVSELKLPKGKEHNVIDACGMLLWHWGKL
jgi:hypothetical protein